MAASLQDALFQCRLRRTHVYNARRDKVNSLHYMSGQLYWRLLLLLLVAALQLLLGDALCLFRPSEQC